MSDTIESSNQLNLESRVRDYIALMKPRVMSLVIFTAIAGIVLSPSNINLLYSLVTIVCVALASGSAAAINMWYDRDIDALMTRTTNRPIVTGYVMPEEALAFGVILSFFACFILFVCVNAMTGMLTVASILIYVFIYTIWLKRISVQNIVIGGASGAIPPMIGYSASNGTVDMFSISMFLIIFLWTPAHFWSLAILRKAEYAKCGVPMMPVIRGDRYTNKLILLYTILTFISSLVPFFLDYLHLPYLIASSILGLYFIVLAIQLYKEQYSYSKFFRFSIIYLFAIFGFMIIDNLL